MAAMNGKRKGEIKMAFCRYCGKQLKNGEKCNCEQSKKREIEFAKEQEQLRKQYYMQKQKEQNQKINNQGGVPGQQPINGDYPGQQPINGCYSGWNQVPQPNGNQGNISQMASGIGKRILSTAVDTFRSPLNAVKNLGNSNSIAESLIISGISMFVLLIELLIACAIIGANLEDQIFGSVFQDMLNSVMKYAILILIGMFLWGLLVAGVMFVVSKYLFHENITFIQTYAVIAVKTLAGVILFTAYVIFFIAMMYVVKIFNSDIGAIIMLIVMLLVIPIVMFTNFIFLYGYFEVLEREPSVKLYEILVMHIVLFIVSLIVGRILGYFIQQAISDSISGIGGWLLSGLFS